MLLIVLIAFIKGLEVIIGQSLMRDYVFFFVMNRIMMIKKIKKSVAIDFEELQTSFQ